MADYPKKYWWLMLVVVPVVLALIAILPTLLAKSGKDAKDDKSTPSAPPGAPTSGPAQNDGAAKPVVAVESPSRTSAPPPPPGTSGVFRATGLGFAPDNIKDAAQRTALARRAAEVSAMRNLTEAIQGAMVDAETKTQGAKLTEDVIRVRVNAVLRWAHTVEEIENLDGSVKVVMEAPTHQ